MKSFLVIGASTFAHHLCHELFRQGGEILLADIHAEAMEELLPYVVSARVCDCTNREALESFGVQNFDTCFVCLGDRILDSLQITDLLKELGAKKIICRAVRDAQVKFLLRNGADEVLYPDKDIAHQIAITESSDDVFNSVRLAQNYYMYEVKAMPAWVGKSLIDLDFRNRYCLNVLGFKTDSGILPVVNPSLPIEKDSRLMLVGHTEDFKALLCR